MSSDDSPNMLTPTPSDSEPLAHPSPEHALSPPPEHALSLHSAPPVASSPDTTGATDDTPDSPDGEFAGPDTTRAAEHAVGSTHGPLTADLNKETEAVARSLREPMPEKRTAKQRPRDLPVPSSVDPTPSIRLFQQAVHSARTEAFTLLAAAASSNGVLAVALVAAAFSVWSSASAHSLRSDWKIILASLGAFAFMRAFSLHWLAAVGATSPAPRVGAQSQQHMLAWLPKLAAAIGGSAAAITALVQGGNVLSTHLLTADNQRNADEQRQTDAIRASRQELLSKAEKYLSLTLADSSFDERMTALRFVENVASRSGDQNDLLSMGLSYWSRQEQLELATTRASVSTMLEQTLAECLEDNQNRCTKDAKEDRFRARFDSIQRALAMLGPADVQGFRKQLVEAGFVIVKIHPHDTTLGMAANETAATRTSFPVVCTARVVVEGGVSPKATENPCRADSAPRNATLLPNGNVSWFLELESGVKIRCECPPH